MQLNNDLQPTQQQGCAAAMKVAEGRSPSNTAQIIARGWHLISLQAELAEFIIYHLFLQQYEHCSSQTSP